MPNITSFAHVIAEMSSHLTIKCELNGKFRNWARYTRSHRSLKIGDVGIYANWVVSWKCSILDKCELKRLCYPNWNYSNITLVNCRCPEHYLYQESACVAGKFHIDPNAIILYHSGVARLAAELKAGTITMEKSDFQLGVGSWLER